MLPITYAGPQPIDPFLLLLAALALEALIGEPPLVFRILPHPVKLLGAIIGWIEKKLNRPQRSQMDRAFRGLLLLLVMLGLAGLASWGVVEVKRAFRFGWVLELLLVWTLLAQRGLFDAVEAVGRALRDQGLSAGRVAVGRIVGRDVERLDEHGVARAAIESCAENFSDAVVAPVFWYVLLGFPGLLAYKTINTLDSMVGHKSERYKAFGVTSARLDDLANLIPARLSGLFLSLAALFVPTANPWRAMKVMLRDSHKHRSPNAGWPEAAMAGALARALSGPRVYAEGPTPEPWLGEEFSARATAQDVKRALYMLGVACLLNGGVVAGLYALKTL